ncbi:MAG: nitrite reductase small subunit NirD [Arcobacter sp.]|nr:nitrite reductase small subunit NirD [Arcobacter sp.]
MANWVKITNIDEIPFMGSRKILIKDKEIAVFKTKDNSIFAVNNECPHKQGNLSEGLVHENQVTCPLHNWDIDLKTGEAQGNDCGCTKTYESKIEKDILYIAI